MSRWVRFGVVLVALAAGACGGNADDDGKGYYVEVYIEGPESFFDGREVLVNGQKAVRPNPNVTKRYGRVCSRDYDRYLKAPVAITVKEGDKILSTTPLERVGCRHSRERVSGEQFSVTLREDGTVFAQLGESLAATIQCRRLEQLCTEETL